MTTRFGKYDLLAQLATGGMAEIWLARISGAAGFEKLVVIKRLLDSLSNDPEYVEMFLDEARINARLSHTNIVHVLELGQVEGSYFMAMEYVAGLSVAQVGKKATQRLGDVPQAVACGIVAQACTGLHYAHEQAMGDGTPLGIIHRDVSPQNLILTFEGLVKVVDFGIAKAEGRQHRTRAGLVKGKSSYMSPEQCLGMPLDRRSDVYALGIVLFELCTARRLFKRPSPYQTFEAITKGDIPPPRALNGKIDAEIENVILRALARKPEDRFATAGELQEALELAMHKAGLRGARADLEKFVESTFGGEITAQRELLLAAQKGEMRADSDASLVSAVAEQAVDELKDAGYSSRRAPSDDKTAIDPLPPLGEDSGRVDAGLPAQAAGLTAQAAGLTRQAAAGLPAQAAGLPAQAAGLPVGGDTENFDDGETIRRDPPPRMGESRDGRDTAPDGVPALDEPLRAQRLPPLYYVLAVLGALLVAGALVWLIAF